MRDQSIEVFLKTVAELWAAARQAATAEAEAEIRRWKARCIAAENGHPQVKEATAEADAKYLPLAEAWLRYKQDMRPETRNDYLRASSRVFDCAIPGSLLEKKEEV